MADFKEFIKGFEEDPNIEKARKLIELGEEPFGTHTYTYEKDGKFYGSGFEDEDIELSSEDMARMYDEYTKAKEEEKNEPKQPMKPLSKDFKKEIDQMRASFKKKFPSAFGK